MVERTDRGGFRRFGVRAIDLGGRVPPHNTEAEMAVLSAVLSSRQALDEVHFLEPSDFYGDAHQRIFEGIRELDRRNQPVDIQTVAAWLKDRDRLQAIGGIAYLAKLVDATPAVAHVAAHARIVREKARIRQLIETCQMVAAAGFGDYGEAQGFIDEAEQAVFAIAHASEAATGAPVGPLVADAYRTTMEAHEGKRHVLGISTGIRALDRMLAGLKRKSEVMIAARPSMGKTALMMNIVRNIAGSVVRLPLADGREGQFEAGVVVFSLESSKEELSERLLSSESRLDLRPIQNGKDKDPEHLAALLKATHDLERIPIWIEDAAGQTVMQMRAAVRRIRAKWEREPVFDGDGKILRLGRRIVVAAIDYIQLVRPLRESDKKSDDLSDVSRDVHDMGKDLDVAMLVLSQLNRGLESRDDKRPRLSDLRESGALEQDADAVVFLYRAYHYIADKTTEAAKEIKDKAEAIVAKQRNGPTGTVGLLFHEEHTRFTDVKD